MFACNGGCPKDRILTTDDGEPALNYLCAGYKAFFHHVRPRMEKIAALLDARCPAEEIMAELVREDAVASANPGVGRNDPCPCGSGRKFKRCHGAP